MGFASSGCFRYRFPVEDTIAWSSVGCIGGTARSALAANRVPFLVALYV